MKIVKYDTDYYDRIIKLINKHGSQYISLETKEGLILNTIYYGKCEYNNDFDMERLVFKSNNMIVSSINLDNVKYNMINHVLVLK